MVSAVPVNAEAVSDMKQLLLYVLACAVAAPALGDELPTAERLANAKYFGYRACRPCHMSRAQGQMFKIWQGTEHAKAYDTLATPRALAVAREHGVESPQTDEKCLRCHASAAGLPDARKHSRFTVDEGVSCESCHGPGEFYKNKNTMCQVVAGIIDRAAVGMTAPTEEVCVRCHNSQSPTWPGSFNYAESVAKISHPLPAARRQKIQDEGCAAAEGSE